MKWLLILFLYNPAGYIEDAKFFPDMGSKAECEANGMAAQKYFAEQGLIVKHKCLTDI